MNTFKQTASLDWTLHNNKFCFSETFYHLISEVKLSCWHVSISVPSCVSVSTSSEQPSSPWSLTLLVVGRTCPARPWLLLWTRASCARLAPPTAGRPHAGPAPPRPRPNGATCPRGGSRSRHRVSAGPSWRVRSPYELVSPLLLVLPD